MPLLSRFRTVSEADKTKAVTKLVSDATFDFDFLFMIVMSVLMATFGLISASEAVVIGSMLLAPIMSPILALALGLSMSSPRLITRSFKTSIKAMIVSVAFAVGATLLFSFSHFSINDTILLRTEPSLVSFAIAFVAGLAVTFALVQPNLSATLPGVAVAVSLMPPLATVGIGIAHFDVKITAGALVMFLVNVVGIVFASMLTFSLMDVHHKRYLVDSAISKEQKRVEKEEEKVKQVAKQVEEEFKNG